MAESLTAEDLVRHFERRVYNLDHNLLNADGEEDPSRRNINALHGGELGMQPHRPMIVFFIGEAAVRHYPAIFASLATVWPRHQYLKALRAVGVRRENDELRYTILTAPSGEDPRMEVGGEYVGGVIDELYEDRYDFSDLTYLHAYYLFDTADCGQPNDLAEALELIEQVRDDVGITSDEANELLFLLLDEGRRARKVAAGIKNLLSDRSGALRADLPVVLLSTLRSDNVRMRGEHDDRRRIVASLIQLSNSGESSASSRLFGSRGVLTVGYVRMEKPLEAIGTVVVRDLAGQLIQASDTNEASSTHAMGDVRGDREALAERLGVTSEGTHAVLDAYAERELFAKLPSREQLELFPRNRSDELDVNMLSEAEFDHLTMRTWDSVLQHVIDAACTELADGGEGGRARLCAEYEAYLFDSFSTDELINLDMDAVREALLTHVDMPVSYGGLIEAARLRLRRMLLHDEQLGKLLIDAAMRQKDRARTHRGALNVFEHSFGLLRRVSDESIESFYGQKVQDYVDHRIRDLQVQYREARTVDELRGFFERAINALISADPVFVESFEQELATRLGNSNQTQAQAAQARIHDVLVTSAPPTYLKTSFNLGVPLVSALLLKRGTSLYDNLTGNQQLRDAGTFFYDTGDGSAAERVEVFEVAPENLMS